MKNYLFLCGQRWIRTTEGVSQQIYSLPHLATLVFAQRFLIRRASCRIRTNDPEITNHVLWPTELKRLVKLCGRIILMRLSGCKVRYLF